MNILHITDLHVTDANQTLATLWNGPQEFLDGHQFDAIVVSGDLTQGAKRAEYKALSEFTETRLMPLLAKDKREPSRVIFVPGNHDVDWALEVGTHVEASQEELKKMWRSHRADPANSNLRIELDPFDLKLFKVEPDSNHYHRRLRNCQLFFDSFYAKKSNTLKRFNLLEKGDDWSAHLFPEEKIAIFGFNSCHRNDKRWTGASIDLGAIVAATEHRKRLCPDFLPVAVWHHGLSAPQGRPDFLSYRDLGRLQEAGFRIGFHGHVHASATWVLRLLRDDFVLISTGSLGAGWQDRPDAVGQQFSIVELYPSRVSVDVYERNQPHGAQYQKNPSASRRFYLRPKRATPQPGNRARERHHSWHVDKEGIARTSVELLDATFSENLVLDVASPPFSSIEYDKAADADGQPLHVVKNEHKDGKLLFTISGGLGRAHKKLAWKYRVSNAFALSQTELELMDPIQNWFPNVKRGHGVLHHVVRHDCDQLVLKLEFEKTPESELQPGLSAVEALVEEKDGDDEWKAVESETQRCEVSITPGHEARCAEVKVSAPVVGMRYSLVFKPSQPGVIIPHRALLLTEEVLSLCRKSVTLSRIGEQLTRAIAGDIQKKFGDTSKKLRTKSARSLARHDLLSPLMDWIGYLWDEEERRLLPAFGEFPLESWGERFALGNGLVGHALRKRESVFWCSPEVKPSSTHVFYQDDIEPYRRLNSKRDFAKVHRWIICVPLWVEAPNGPVFGVVGLAGRKNLEPQSATMRLDALVQSVVRGQRDSKEQILLERTINASFWAAIKASDELQAANRKVADQFFRAVRGMSRE